MPTALTALTECIGPQLDAVECLFNQELRSDLPGVNVLVKHVSRFRGKMLRPTLLLLWGKACGSLCDAHITVATVVEMVHMATLVRQANAFGRALGIAFQIQDDILDIIGDARDVGKTLGIDIEKVKLTLPIIHFLRSAPREHQQLLRSLLQSREPDKVEKIRN